MNRRQILERERRGQRLAGFAAIAAAPLYIVSLFSLRGTGVPLTGLATEQLRAVDEVGGQVILAGVLSALALALITIPLYYLFRAAQARSERVNPAMIGFVFIGPLLLGVQTLIKAIAQIQLASDFVADVGPRRRHLHPARRPDRREHPERDRLVPDPPGAARAWSSRWSTCR